MERILGLWRLDPSLLPKRYPRQERNASGTALQPTRDVERMRRALTFIDARYADRMTLADIAASMMPCRRASAAACSGACCARARWSYAISCRIRESLSLLAAGRLSVTEIAQRTGFSGSSYFTETFRRRSWA
jgi:AraC-like DNA-binding protein